MIQGTRKPVSTVQTLLFFLGGSRDNTAGDVAEIKKAASLGRRSNNPYRVLKSVVDMLRQRYMSKNYEPMSAEEILTLLDLTDLATETRLWLVQVGGHDEVAV